MDKEIRKALELFNKKEYGEVIEICDNLLAKEFDIKVLLLKGKCLQDLGLSSEAEMIYSEAIKHDSKNYLANYELGTFSLNRADYKTAIKFYQEAHSVNPDDADILNNIGLCYLHQGEYDEALKWYQEAHSVNPDDADILNNIAMGYDYKGDSQNALKYFDLALEFTPFDGDILHKREVIANKLKQL